MVLPMTRPFKHPKTGIYWLRKRVPKDLLSVVGRNEITKSLQTRDPTEAKLRLVQALAELDAQWTGLKKGPHSITEREAHAYALSVYKAWLDRNRDDPSFNEMWVTRLYHRLWTDIYVDKEGHFSREKSDDQANIDLAHPYDNVSLKFMHRHCEKEAAEIFMKYGLARTVPNLWTMAQAVGAAMQRASLILEKEAQGIFEPGTEPKISDGRVDERHEVHQLTNLTSLHRDQKHQTPANKVSLKGLVEAWWAEAKTTGRKPSTFESYGNTFANFGRFLDHDDAGRVTIEDVIRFKDYRLTTPSIKTGRVTSAKTVKGTDLSALKTVFGWAVANRRLSENPAASVTLKVGKAPRLRSKGLSDVEANAILSLSRKHVSDRETPYTAAGKRWVPWLCALTGARVGEMAQLRKEDVRVWQDHWVVRITPAAGTVKTNEARDVVLHTQLVELGFPAFVQNAPDGPLFLRPRKNGDVLGPLQGLKNRLAEFARQVVTDENVAPMHGFRHRFKTIGREVGVPLPILDAIQGHSARSIADSYGDVTLTAIAAAIAKFPYMEAGNESDTSAGMDHLNR